MSEDPFCLRCGVNESALGSFFCKPCCDIVNAEPKAQPHPPAPLRKLGADPGRNYTKKGILR